MKKKVIALFTAFMMLVSFVTPTFAKENIIEVNEEKIVDTRAVPGATHYFTKTRTAGGVAVKIKIQCDERYLTDTSIVNYTSGNCTLVSVQGGTARITGDFKSGSTGVGVDNDLIVIVYYTYSNDNGTTGSSSVSFTIRGNKLV